LVGKTSEESGHLKVGGGVGRTVFLRWLLGKEVLKMEV
jgi:hypothetical protein